MGDRTAAVKLTLRNDGFVAGLRQAKTQTTEFANSIQEGAKRNKGSLDTLANDFGAVGLAAAGVFAVAVKKFADFDAAMSGVQAATHETAGNMQVLREAAVQAGKDTAFSATEAAGAIENLAKAGVSTKDILGGGLSGALSLAAAGELDVGDAAEIAATAMTQFKLSGKDIPHIADLLAAGAGKAQGEVSDMAQALKQSGLVAAQFGLSIDETVGTLSAFASAGLIGSDAGTSFKTMLLALANPSVKAAGTLKELGIAAYDTKGNFVGIAPLAEQLKSKLQDLTPAQRDAALATIFGSDAIRAANVLYQNGAAGIADWTTKVNDQGYAAETAALKTDNLKGDLERLGGAIDTALIQSGEGANDTLRSIVKGADAAVSAFSDLPGWVQKGAVALTGLVGAGALGAGGLIKGVQAAAELRGALQKLDGVSKGLKFGLGGVGLALAAAAVVFGVFAKKNADAKAKVDELKQSLDQQTGAITGNTRAFVSNELATSGISKKAKDLGLSLSLVTDAALGNEAALTQVRSAIDAIAASNMDPNTGALGDQAKAARDVGLAVTGMSGSLSDAQQQQKLAAEGAKQNKSAQELQAEAVKTANEAFKQQAEDLNSVIDAMNKMPGLVLSLRDAQRGWQEAVQGASDALKENGKTLDITTPKGRANQEQLDGMAKAANDVTESMIRNGESNLKVVRTYEANREGLIKTAQQFGLNKKQAEEYADKVLAIPKRSDTTVRADITDLEKKLRQAKASLNDKNLTKARRAEIQANIKDLESKLATAKAALAKVPKSKTVTITTKYVTVGTPAQKSRAAAQGHTPGSAGGGLIPGPPSSVDNHMRAMATGEFVVQASQVQANLATLNAINEGRFRQTSFSGGGGSTTQNVQVAAPDVRVFIGNEEITDRMQIVVDSNNRKLKRDVRQGLVR